MLSSWRRTDREFEVLMKLFFNEEVRGRVALPKSQLEIIVSAPFGDRKWQSWSKWDWNLKGKIE